MHGLVNYIPLFYEGVILYQCPNPDTDLANFC